MTEIKVAHRKGCYLDFPDLVKEGFIERETKPFRHFAWLKNMGKKSPFEAMSVRFFYCPFCGKKLDVGK